MFIVNDNLSWSGWYSNWFNCTGVWIQAFMQTWQGQLL